MVHIVLFFLTHHDIRSAYFGQWSHHHSTQNQLLWTWRYTQASQTATSWRCDQAWKAKQFNVLYYPNSQKEFHITEPATKPDWHTRIYYPTLTEQLKAPLGKKKKKVTGTKTHLTALVLKPNNISGCETLACLKEVKQNRLKAKINVSSTWA